MGRGIHMVRARPRAKIGARINIEAEDVAGRSGYLLTAESVATPGLTTQNPGL